MPTTEQRLLLVASRRATIKSAFGKRLRTTRVQAGLTPEELAEKSELNATTINKAETGLVDPRLSLIDALARGLGVPWSALIHDTIPAAANSPDPGE
jgi:XRE family transcriptional regulator, fatty acid utilization regulator